MWLRMLDLPNHQLVNKVPRGMCFSRWTWQEKMSFLHQNWMHWIQNFPNSIPHQHTSFFHHLFSWKILATSIGCFICMARIRLIFTCFNTPFFFFVCFDNTTSQKDQKSKLRNLNLRFNRCDELLLLSHHVIHEAIVILELY